MLLLFFFGGGGGLFDPVWPYSTLFGPIFTPPHSPERARTRHGPTAIKVRRRSPEAAVLDFSDVAIRLGAVPLAARQWEPQMRNGAPWSAAAPSPRSHARETTMHKQLASVLVSSTRELKRSGSAPPNVLDGLDLGDILGSPNSQAGARGRDLGSLLLQPSSSSSTKGVEEPASQGIDFSSRAYVEYYYANRLCNPR